MHASGGAYTSHMYQGVSILDSTLVVVDELASMRLITLHGGNNLVYKMGCEQ
jgi:hypothetical protein